MKREKKPLRFDPDQPDAREMRARRELQAANDEAVAKGELVRCRSCRYMDSAEWAPRRGWYVESGVAVLCPRCREHGLKLVAATLEGGR